MNIFERLKEKDVCYCVEISYIFPLIRGVDEIGVDYKVLILKKDMEAVKGIVFSNCTAPNYKNKKNLMERTLRKKDRRAFLRAKGHHLKKVVDTEDGMIYEIVGNSFKEKYKKYYGKKTKIDD